MRGGQLAVVDGVAGYRSDDDDELAAGLRALHLIDRGACRQRIADCFSVERMVEGHLRVYEQQRAAASQGWGR